MSVILSCPRKYDLKESIVKVGLMRTLVVIRITCYTPGRRPAFITGEIGLSAFVSCSRRM